MQMINESLRRLKPLTEPTFKQPTTVVVRAELTAVHKTIEYINTNL